MDFFQTKLNLNKIKLGCFLSVFILMIIQCTDKKESTSTVSSQEGVKYEVDTTSKINWSGYKIEKSLQLSHFGTLKFKSGNIIINQNVIVGGELIADMNSIDNQDVENIEQRNKLITNLKSPDFFDTRKYPISSFKITSYQPLTEGDFNSEIKGIITIKGKEKEITVKSNTEITDSLVAIRTEKFGLSRKSFGIDYPGLGDIILEDNFDLQIECITHKKP